MAEMYSTDVSNEFNNDNQDNNYDYNTDAYENNAPSMSYVTNRRSNRRPRIARLQAYNSEQPSLYNGNAINLSPAFYHQTMGPNGPYQGHVGPLAEMFHISSDPDEASRFDDPFKNSNIIKRRGPGTVNRGKYRRLGIRAVDDVDDDINSSVAQSPSRTNNRDDRRGPPSYAIVTDPDGFDTTNNLNYFKGRVSVSPTVARSVPLPMTQAVNSIQRSIKLYGPN